MYSKVSKYSHEAHKRMPYRSSKGKSCGYYMRIVFFFSSLIQSLIIVSLVLFLIYGKQQDSASVARTQDLELRFSQLSLETVSLRQQRKNLTHLLNVTTMEKARNDWDLAQLRALANISFMLLDETEKRLKLCMLESMIKPVNCPPEIRPPMHSFQQHFGIGCNCGTQMETLRRRMEVDQANFTQTAMKMQMEMDQIAKDRDNLNLEAIQLRRDKSVHDKAIQFYQIKCKEEFVNSLSGISNVSKAFLNKIDSLFHALSPFHLTCPKQKDYLDQIRNNCTDLSEEVVTKFQTYLDRLGDRVSMYQGNISVLTAENMRMTRDYTVCSQNRTGLIREHKKHVERVQLQYDDEKEKLLKEKIKLKGEIEVLERSVSLKDSQLEHVKEQLKYFNLSCIPRTGGLFPRLGNQPGSPWGLQPGSSNPSLSNSPGGLGQFNRNNFGSSSSSSSSGPLGSPFGSTNTNTGLGSSSSSFNKPSSTGFGSSSLGSNSGLGSSTLNKLGSSNQGSSSSSSYGSPFGSSGTGLNKQTSTGLGSSSSSSSFGFGSSNNPSSSSSSQNKFGSSGATGGSSSFGSSSSSLGSSSSNLGSSSFGSSSNSGLGSSSSSSLSKTTSNSRGSSNSFFGSSSSSSGSSLGSSSSSQNKLSSTSNKGSSSSSSSSPSSSSSSSSSGSSGSTANKGGFGWWGLGGGSSSSSSSSSTSSSSSSSSSSNSDQNKLGNNQGRGAFNSGNSFGSFGSGRTNTFSLTGPISVNQHLRDLQRIINPQGTEEKQELSRVMG